MSIEVMTAVWKLDLPTNRKIVLLKMADVADDDGRNSFQSIEFIAAHTGQGKRTVQRHRMEFENDGVLIVEAYGKGGRGRFKNFRIDIDRAREIYGCIKVPAGKGVKLAPFTKGANGDENGANPCKKPSQSLTHDSSLNVSDDPSRAREAGAAPTGALASAPDSTKAVTHALHARSAGSRYTDVVKDTQGHQLAAAIAAFKDALPAIRQAVAAVAPLDVAAFGETLFVVSDDGGRLVLSQPSIWLRDTTIKHQSIIERITGKAVNVRLGTFGARTPTRPLADKQRQVGGSK